MREQNRTEQEWMNRTEQNSEYTLLMTLLMTPLMTLWLLQPLAYSNIRSVIPRFKAEKKAATADEYEQLLRNPDRIDLKFQIRGNIVVKKTSDRAQLVVGRQAPASS